MSAPLSAIRLNIDRRREGWLQKASARGAELLEQSGRPAMATELRRIDLGTIGALEQMRRFVRLHLRPGTAPALPPAMAGSERGRSGAVPIRIAPSVTEAWKYPARLGGLASPAVYGGRVFFADGQNLCCVSLADGQELWRTLVYGEANRPTPPVVVDGKVVVVTERSVVALSAESGEILWRHNAPEGPNFCAHTPALPIDGDLVFRSDGNALTLLSLADGAERGRHPQGLSRHADWPSRFKEAPWNVGTPAASAGGALLVPVDDHLFCLTSPYRGLKWHTRLPDRIACGPIITGRTVLAGLANGFLHSLDLKGGRRRWEHRVLSSQKLVLAASGGLVVAAYGLSLRAWKAETGEGRWVRALDWGVTHQAPPLALGAGAGLVGTLAGLEAFSLDTGRPLWRFTQGMPAHAPVISACGRILYVDTEGILHCLQDAG